MQPVTLIVTGRSLHQSELLYRPKGRWRNGRWVPLPKSAPPQLARRRAKAALNSAASVRNMRVASAHSAKPSQLSPRLSVNDVYKLAERRHLQTCQESRHLMLTEAQKMVRNDWGMSRPETGWTFRGSSQRHWRASSTPGHVIIQRKLRADAGEGGLSEREDSDREGLGFVSNVEISVKPRLPSAGHHPRHGSAVTSVSSYLGSELVCASPRPGDPEARKMSVARQCCEVMGPGVCRDCQKLRVRMMDRERMEADFPRLRVSETNVTTSTIVKRVLPQMSQAEIQDKIARGEIARTALLFPRRHRRCPTGNKNESDDDDVDDDDDDDKENGDRLRFNGLYPGQEENNGSEASGDRYSREEGEGADSPDEAKHADTFLTQPFDRSESQIAGAGRAGGAGSGSRVTSSKSVNSIALLAKLKIKLRGEASTPLFFMDLKHQNSKIFQGRVLKSLHPPKEMSKREEEEEREENEMYLTVPKQSNPVFVSPRKSKPTKEPAYKVFYNPPLLTKAQQISNPSFFAGSDDPYSLPERLPDIIEFADGKLSITDPSAAMRSESSMSFVSEEGPQLSQRSKGPKEGTVHE